MFKKVKVKLFHVAEYHDVIYCLILLIHRSTYVLLIKLYLGQAGRDC